MKTWDTTGALLCATGMAIVGSSVAVSRGLLDYPALTGQAVRYAVAAVILAAIATRTPAPRNDACQDAPSAREGVPSRPAERAIAGVGTAPFRRAAERADAGGGSGAFGRPTGREWLVLVALAATGLAGFNAAVLIALAHADTAFVGTVVGAAPLGLAVLAPLAAGRTPSARVVAAASTVVVGAVLTQSTGHADAVGALAAAAALVGEVSFSMLAALVLTRLGAVRVAAWSCALAVPLLMVVAVIAGEPARWRLPTATEALTLGYLAVMMTAVAFVAWFTGLQRLGIERAGMMTGLLPVAALLTAAAQDGAWPAPGQALGVLTVAAGLAIGLTTPAPGPDPTRTNGQGAGTPPESQRAGVGGPETSALLSADRQRGSALGGAEASALPSGAEASALPSAAARMAQRSAARITSA